MERLCDFGPGMQAGRRDGRPTLFGGDGTFTRQDDSPDGLFYAAPRMINHVDMQASMHLGEIYARHWSLYRAFHPFHSQLVAAGR